MKTTAMDLHDDLSVEIERAEVLTGHLEQRLSKMAELATDDPDKELYALSLIAEAVSARLKVILAGAQTLCDAVEATMTLPPSAKDAKQSKKGGA